MFMYYATNIGSCRKHVTTRYTLQQTRYSISIFSFKNASAFFTCCSVIVCPLVTAKIDNKENREWTG